jgi:hypothetical protein
MTLATFHNPATRQPWQVRIVESVKDLATASRAPSAEFIAAGLRQMLAVSRRKKMARAAEVLLRHRCQVYLLLGAPNCERFLDVCDECSYELGRSLQS